MPGLTLLLATVWLIFATSAADAATCGNGAGGFNRWVREVRGAALANGIRGATFDAAMAGVSYHSRVISLDRNQKSFKLSLDQFMARRAPASFVSKGKRIMRANGKLLASIQRKYGVQPEVLIAIWGMETGFGSNVGNMSIIRSLATLAYDCRRSAFFTNEFLAALKILQRGDMSPSQMKGAWAGEVGQTQFLASNYIRFAVDFDRNGRRDLIRSKADALASTANYLKAYGWRRGAGYQRGQANFAVLKQWNKAGVYQKALALFAHRLAN